MHVMVESKLIMNFIERERFIEKLSNWRIVGFLPPPSACPFAAPSRDWEKPNCVCFAIKFFRSWKNRGENLPKMYIFCHYCSKVCQKRPNTSPASYFLIAHYLTHPSHFAALNWSWHPWFTWTMCCDDWNMSQDVFMVVRFLAQNKKDLTLWICRKRGSESWGTVLGSPCCSSWLAKLTFTIYFDVQQQAADIAGCN